MTELDMFCIDFLKVSMTTEERSRAAILGWINHDIAALKRSYASVKGWETRRRN
tara:strand:- start:3 stop:164 length:162 start_codon:yes stop_codon:yes gene_type:complete